jgi:glycerol-3-phosphate dehydrogenase
VADAVAWREQVRRRLQVESFDVVIVGGGITGAGVARDAALRGLRVALLEAGDFASGTSSRSSRLIHGGVRYLEHGHLHLVFESSRERRVLMRIAPHLVRPLAFVWPVYRGARVSRLKLAAGLGLYDALSMFRNVARHDRLSRREVMESEPRLESDGLLGGARYYDAATDDARLTLANVLAAVELGAAVKNHAAVIGFEIVNNRVRGVRVSDAMTGDEFTIRAGTVVNATGPWSDELRAMESRIEHPSVTGSRGAHIAVARERLGNRQAVTMLHPHDGRVLFTLPAGDQAIIGTTETPTHAADRESRATDADVRYLLDAANSYFPQAQLGTTDVIAAWAGIRPLARQDATEDVGSASREHTIVRGPKGVVHVTGGKLTTFRAMASQVVDGFANRGTASDRTASIPLPGGECPVEELVDDATEVVDDEAVRMHLVRSYGSRWRDVWSLGDGRPELRERLSSSHAVIGAEMVYGVRREMAMTLGDLLIRRTHLAFACPDQARFLAPNVATLVGPELGWASSKAALADYEVEVQRTFAIEGT